MSHSLIPFLPGGLSKSLEGSVACGRVREGVLSPLSACHAVSKQGVCILFLLFISSPLWFILAKDTGISMKARSGSKTHLGWTGQAAAFTVHCHSRHVLFLQFGAFAHAVPSAWNALPYLHCFLWKPHISCQAWLPSQSFS